MLRRELKFYWIALSADFAYMLFVFTVTRLMAENQASLMALGILGAVSSLGFGLGLRSEAGLLTSGVGAASSPSAPPPRHWSCWHASNGIPTINGSTCMRRFQAPRSG